MDVRTIFFNGELEEDIYRDQPKEFLQCEYKYFVCKLKKSLYRLKQTSRAWYQKNDATLWNLDSEISIVDHNLYFSQERTNLMQVLVYVDNLIKFLSNMEAIITFKSKLEAKYEMTN